MPGVKPLVLVMLLLAAVPAAAAEPPALVKARTLYNAGDYDGAILAASEVQVADWTDAARLVIARSHLERYRRSTQAADLAAGGVALAEVRASSLLPRDHVDLLIGLGQHLYFSSEFGAAANLFDSALAEGFLLNRQDRLLLLDWWANAVDRSAQTRPPDRRAPAFVRVVERMEDEIRRDSTNQVAGYWLAVGYRGSGDIERAWDAAVAAWVRSHLAEDGREAVRDDLERLVTQGIIPERARLQKDSTDASRTMRDQWETIKRPWTQGP
jgi:hypothetical protein